jgi:hypothetical protein
MQLPKAVVITFAGFYVSDMVEKWREPSRHEKCYPEERAIPGFEKVDVGDLVVRMLAGAAPMKPHASRVTDQVTICGDWKFYRATEIDELLGWGHPLMTGSYLDPSKVELSNPMGNPGKADAEI